MTTPVILTTQLSMELILWAWISSLPVDCVSCSHWWLLLTNLQTLSDFTSFPTHVLFLVQDPIQNPHITLSCHVSLVFSNLRQFLSFHYSMPLTFLFVFFLSLFILRETESMRRGGGEREGEREFQAGSALSAWSQKWGLNPWTVRSWPELKLRIGCLTH